MRHRRSKPRSQTPAIIFVVMFHLVTGDRDLRRDQIQETCRPVITSVVKNLQKDGEVTLRNAELTTISNWEVRQIVREKMSHHISVATVIVIVATNSGRVLHRIHDV